MYLKMNDPKRQRLMLLGTEGVLFPPCEGTLFRPQFGQRYERFPLRAADKYRDRAAVRIFGIYVSLYGLVFEPLREFNIPPQAGIADHGLVI